MSHSLYNQTTITFLLTFNNMSANQDSQMDVDDMGNGPTVTNQEMKNRDNASSEELNEVYQLYSYALPENPEEISEKDWFATPTVQDAINAERKKDSAGKTLQVEIRSFCTTVGIDT